MAQPPFLGVGEQTVVFLASKTEILRSTGAGDSPPPDPGRRSGERPAQPDSRARATRSFVLFISLQLILLNESLRNGCIPQERRDSII